LQIGFIGAGKVGQALGLYFHNHSLNVTGYYSRTEQSAHLAASLIGTKVFNSLAQLAQSCDVIFITTPDRVLADIDRAAALYLEKEKCGGAKIWLHASGAFTSAHLAELKLAGSGGGSMHPLQSFGDPLLSAEKLEKTYYTIEGTPKAVAAMRSILDKTGGAYSLIDAGLKPLYHAGACVISNYLVTLIDSGIRYFTAIGMDKEKVFQAIEPMLAGTLANIRQKGTVEALTGPIVRGDIDTVRTHIEAIKKDMPSELELYRVMALKTVEMISEEKLSAGQILKFKEMLKGSATGE